MEIKRVWAMPSRHTFTIKPIKELLERWVKDGKGWIDPFAGENSPAEITNDLNKQKPTDYHEDARDFVKRFNGFKGALFDPPYSPRQVKECYDGIGKEVTAKDTKMSFWSEIKNELGRRVKTGGIIICCGWNSMGLGKGRGFEMLEILLVPHGATKNDTIVTVERKVQSKLGEMIDNG